MKLLLVSYSGSSSNLVVNSLFLYFQVDNCPFCLLKKNRHRLNKITQVSEVNLCRLNRYLHPYTFLQLTLLTPFAGCQVLMRK